MGILQGVTELFPVSSLGHSVVIPSLIPGWHGLARAQSQPESFFLAFLVALHVGTALALVLFFRREWVRIVGGFFRTIGKRRIETKEGRLAGISRSGITMVAGLVRGLDHEDAARFSFLLATPIILAAGVYKLPDLLGPNGDGVRGQVLAGSAAAAVAAYLSVRFLTRWFQTRTLTPFAIYCLVAGVACIVR